MPSYRPTFAQRGPTPKWNFTERKLTWGDLWIKLNGIDQWGCYVVLIGKGRREPLYIRFAPKRTEVYRDGVQIL